MSTTRSPDRAPWLAPQEVLFLALVVFGWAFLVVSLGKDMSWDFRNYHWYIPYALLNHRAGLDVAVAHQATYYNPFLDIPFYLLATHTHAWFALGTLGAIQGLNVVPLYLIGRSILQLEEKRLAAGVLTLLCMTGGLTIGLSGKTYYDDVMSVFILSALAMLITQRATLAMGTIRQGVVIAGIAGFIVGVATGLKLPEAIFALGFGAALIMLPGDAKHRGTRVAAGVVAGLAGILIVAGYWFVRMYHETGNPLFPYFNQFFASPLALTTSYRDLRFVPRGLDHILLFPLLFTIDWHVADDLPFQDLRVGLAYVLTIVSIPVLLIAKRSRDPLVAPDAAAALFGFAAVSYAAWIAMFGIYRYILALEMLAPILIVSAIGLWPMARRTQLTTLGVLAVLAMAYTRVDWLERAPVDNPYIQVDVPTIPHAGNTIVLMAGEAPMGFMAPSFPHQIPILRIDGWMIQPQDGSKLTAATKARVARFKGDLYLLANEYEIGRAAEALNDYGLSMRYLECADIATNLGGPYKFCPVQRLTDKKP